LRGHDKAQSKFPSLFSNLKDLASTLLALQPSVRWDVVVRLLSREQGRPGTSRSQDPPHELENEAPNESGPVLQYFRCELAQIEDRDLVVGGTLGILLVVGILPWRWRCVKMPKIKRRNEARAWSKD
jgi:hypothetical protein